MTIATGKRSVWFLLVNENQAATCDRPANVCAGQDFSFRCGLVSVATWCSSRF